MRLVFFIGSVSLLFIILISAGTNHKPVLIFAFHQNYPEFDNRDDVKDLYEILKDSPYFKSKIAQLENITNDVSIGCNIDTFVLDEMEEKKTAKNLEICDEDIKAMKAECDKHYNVMAYCKEKSDFITSYIITRNLTEESVGKIASGLLP